MTTLFRGACVIFAIIAIIVVIVISSDTIVISIVVTVICLGSRVALCLGFRGRFLSGGIVHENGMFATSADPPQPDVLRVLPAYGNWKPKRNPKP